MILLHPEIQPTLIKTQRKELIDYEKYRNNDYDITPPQRHLSDEFGARKELFDMPTCYAMDKQFEEKFWNGPKEYNNNRGNFNKHKEDNLVKERNNEDKIDFLFKVKRKQQRRKSTSNFLHCFERNTRRRNSDSALYLRRRIEKNDALCTFKSSIIKQILRKDKIQRSCSLNHLGKEFKQESFSFGSISTSKYFPTISPVKSKSSRSIFERRKNGILCTIVERYED